jgi:hypothetical protein
MLGVEDAMGFLQYCKAEFLWLKVKIGYGLVIINSHIVSKHIFFYF